MTEKWKLYCTKAGVSQVSFYKGLDTPPQVDALIQLDSDPDRGIDGGSYRITEVNENLKLVTLELVRS